MKNEIITPPFKAETITLPFRAEAIPKSVNPDYCMDRLIPVVTPEDIPAVYADTPIGLLLKFHNMHEPFPVFSNAQLLVGMCMDNRKHLHIPDNFAFIIRAGGANLRYSGFKVSYAIGVGGVRHIALIGHNHCGMVNLEERHDVFVEGLMKNAGWAREKAEEHFMENKPRFEIVNEIDFILSEVRRIRTEYPAVQVAPMLYLVEDNLLYLLDES